ncbi:hypothetical protein CAPTEDRAFT_207418 [Capitella teleta]|uniref:G-protein coupled receptors family 1 profile domain-containing protein n=1 Tax=Capitella teleta TaxID=283909 RepID=R7UDY2_CAPTE|nr:hypothetical protein CAPTEDRAFT_207418 [Capitella teleta]|eukprot:ELU04615.1 hypothetical protein CAPTEDRAFT_207418 [Capitella teleta]
MAPLLVLLPSHLFKLSLRYTQDQEVTVFMTTGFSIESYKKAVLANPLNYIGDGLNTYACLIHFNSLGYFEFRELWCVCYLACAYYRKSHPEELVALYNYFVEDRVKKLPLIWKLRWNWVLIYSIIGLAGITGNTLIIMAIFRYMKKSATHTLMLTIASSDLLTSLVCLPIEGYQSFYGAGILGIDTGMLIVCKLSYFLFYASFGCSIIAMVALGIERVKNEYIVQLKMKTYLCIPDKMVDLKLPTTVTLKEDNRNFFEVLFEVFKLCAHAGLGLRLQQRRMSGEMRDDTDQYIIKLFQLTFPNSVLVYFYATHQNSVFKVIRMLLTMLAIFVIAWGPFLFQAFYLPLFTEQTTRFLKDQRTPRMIYTALSFSSATFNSIFLPINSK